MDTTPIKKYLKSIIKPYAYVLITLIMILVAEAIGLWDIFKWPATEIKRIILSLVTVLIVILIGVPFFLFRKDRLKAGGPF